MATDTDIARRLRISRCYVRGPGDIAYDTRGFHDKSDGKPVGHVEDERREAADLIDRLRADVEGLVSFARYVVQKYDAVPNSADRAVLLPIVERARAVLQQHKGA